MPIPENTLKNQIKLIEEAMKKAGVWSEEVPEWIFDYKEGSIVNVWQWLQFIHLPMRLQGSLPKTKYLAPQLSSFMSHDPAHSHILQLVIELDSITPTIKKN